MGGVCAQAISRKHRIPYIITEHNYLTFKKSETLMRFESAVSNAAYVLLVSEYQKRVLRLWNIGKNLIVTGNYVNDSLFRISDQENYKKFKIIFIGRYAHHKDFKTLFNTIIKFSELVDSNQYFFRIIGVQKKKVSHFTQSLDAKGLASCYQISEFLERQETAKEMRSSDVLLSTSIAETFGVTICEAMMSGKPVVSTNNGGFDEMYVERINGIKCPIGDADALACALYRVYNGEFSVNPEDIRNSVLHKFGAQAFKDKMSKIYENAISSS
jgi:glycosyltransferase involved in cell wall biosynthesis